MILIKDAKTLRGVMCGFHPTLVDIAVWILTKYEKIVITCGHRKNDIGVHGMMPCRGLDLRSWIYPHPEFIVSDVNNMWEYDYDRPEMNCAMLHDAGSGSHLHFQTHPNTRRR